VEKNSCPSALTSVLQALMIGERADLREADLTWVDLEGADLREADLRGTNLLGAHLEGVDLRGADFFPLIYLFQFAYLRDFECYFLIVVFFSLILSSLVRLVF
jgi:hypothetical protein